jgi:glycosyltransferase involved in cell wall biosynthesis
MKISIAITSYNRIALTLKSFANVVDDDRISEIIIVDDCSKRPIFEELKKGITHPKVKLIQNKENLGMSRNKANAISLCSSEWVIILDSDNDIDSTYLDAFFASFDNNHRTFYCPSFAKPEFDYRKYEGMNFNAISIKSKLKEGSMQCLLNTSNYVVNRDWFASVYRHDESVKETDTHWVNYLNLKAGGSLYVVPGMHYNHLVHKDSGWMQNANYNMKKAQSINRLIEQI